MTTEYLKKATPPKATIDAATGETVQRMLAEIKAEDGSSYRAFVTQTMNPYGFPAKDRSGQLDLLEPPDLRALIDKCAAATHTPSNKE